MSCGICVLPGILLQVWHSLNSYCSVMREYKTALILFIELLNLLIMVSYSLNPTPFEFRGFFSTFLYTWVQIFAVSLSKVFMRNLLPFFDYNMRPKLTSSIKKKSKIILCLYRRVCMQCMQTQIVFLLLLWEF